MNLQALYDLSGVLNRSADVSEMTAHACRELKNSLGTPDVHMVVFRDSQSMLPEDPASLPGTRTLERSGEARSDFDRIAKRLLQIHNIEAVVPVSLNDRLLGAVILAPRTSGGRYGAEEMRFLGVFAHQAALVIERMRLLEEMRRRSKELESHAQERASDLEQVLVDISHRLQTPLTVVKSELDSLKRRLDLPREIYSFEQSIDHISRFVYDLLNLAALNVRREELPVERLDLGRIIDELIEYFRVMAGENGINLSSKIDSGIFVIGNKEHLEELVMNLVSNAFKYQREGTSKMVGIFLRRAGDSAVLEVTDNGCGIPPEDLERIFERFYRGEQTAPGGTPGSGLGLAIAKKIAENHGGAIIIQSEAGKGTKVTVELPLRRIE
jgi:signal transduction histidine kinase